MNRNRVNNIKQLKTASHRLNYLNPRKSLPNNINNFSSTQGVNKASDISIIMKAHITTHRFPKQTFYMQNLKKKSILFTILFLTTIKGKLAMQMKVSAAIDIR